MTKKNIIDTIVSQAKLEEADRQAQIGYSRMLEKREMEKEGKIIPDALIAPSSYKVVVNINEIPVSFKTFTSYEKDVFVTKGSYMIMYFPKASRKSVPGKPYFIYQDLIHMRLCVSGPAHWRCLCRRIPELDWIRRNTNFTNDLFALAKRHPGIPFFFSIDYSKYAKKIMDQAEKEGIDIDNKPFVAYKCSEKDYQELYKDKFLHRQRTKTELAPELNAAEKDEEVISEIKKEKNK